MDTYPFILHYGQLYYVAMYNECSNLRRELLWESDIFVIYHLFRQKAINFILKEYYTRVSFRSRGRGMPP